MAVLKVRGGNPLNGHKVSSENSNSEVAVARPCLFGGIMVRPGKTGAVYNSVTILGIYDNATQASGTRIVPRNLEIPAGTQPLYTLSIDPAIICNNGIAVAIQGAGDVRWQVLYDDGI